MNEEEHLTFTEVGELTGGLDRWLRPAAGSTTGQ
jgi:hypothetical protein